MNETMHIRDEILMAALSNVAFDGWTWDMVCRSADEGGYSANIARGVFPEKMVSVLDHFADWADRKMMEGLADIDPQDLRIRDRVRVAVLARFDVLAAHKDAVNQSLNFWMWPTRKARAVKVTWRTADVIWTWTGDDSANYSHYTKRGILSGVIASSTLAWLNDTSEDMGHTKVFLDKRIENVMQLGKVIRTLKAKVS